MLCCRRSVLLALVAVIALGKRRSSAQVLFDTAPPLPKPDMFESGDLLWPKKPGAFVPYSQRAEFDIQRDREIWEREKSEFLDRVAREKTYLSAQQIDALRALDYREFLARYHGDQQPGIPGVYSSGGGIYVGHVGIIDVASSGAIFVVEALWGRGVIRHSYDEWLANRPNEVIWLGRVKGRSNDERASIVEEAKKYINRPYDFWNFDLNDDHGFYCSKLVWLSVFRSLSFAIDGNSNPERAFWFSPKQLLYLPAIDRIHDPGPYAVR